MYYYQVKTHAINGNTNDCDYCCFKLCCINACRLPAGYHYETDEK